MSASHRPLAVTLIASAALAAAAVPAVAHPFGAPLQIHLAAEDDTVTLYWRAEEDDWVTLGRVTGAFDEPPADGQAVADAGTALPVSGLERIQAWPNTRNYLVGTLTVEQDGVPCPTELVDLDDPLGMGAVLHYRCPTDVEVVRVTAGTLTDVHDAYRTVGSVVGVAGSSQLHTATDPDELYDLSGRGGGSWASAGLAIGAAVLGLGALLPRRRGRRAAAEPQTDAEVGS